MHQRFPKNSWQLLMFHSHIILDISSSFLKHLMDNSLQPQSNDKSLQRWLDHELEVMVNIHEVRSEYEKQSQVYVLSLSL